MASKLKSVRCAIYTRKSSEEGLQQEFNSLDAQREAAQAYIASQQHEGWTCLDQRALARVGRPPTPAFAWPARQPPTW